MVFRNYQVIRSCYNSSNTFWEQNMHLVHWQHFTLWFAVLYTSLNFHSKNLFLRKYWYKKSFLKFISPQIFTLFFYPTILHTFDFLRSLVNRKAQINPAINIQILRSAYLENILLLSCFFLPGSGVDKVWTLKIFLKKLLVHLNHIDIDMKQWCQTIAIGPITRNIWRWHSNFNLCFETLSIFYILYWGLRISQLSQGKVKL